MMDTQHNLTLGKLEETHPDSMDPFYWQILTDINV